MRLRISFYASLALFFVFSSAQAQTLVQLHKKNTAGTSGNSVSDSFTTNTTVSNAILVFCAVQGAVAGTPPTYSVTDTQGNSYTLTAGTLNGPSNFAPTFAFATNIIGGADTITCSATAGGNNNGAVMVILEESGLEQSAALDTSAGDQGSVGYASTYTTPSITTANANDLIVTGVIDDSTISGATPSFAIEVNSSGTNYDAGYADKTTSSTGTYSATFTLTSSSNAIGSILALKTSSLSSRQAPNCGGADDRLTHMPTASDWNTRAAPGKGNSYLDPLGAAISGGTSCRAWQITDATSDLLESGSLHCPISIEYSPMGSLFNADNSLVDLWQSGCGTHHYIVSVSNVTGAGNSPPTSTTFPIWISPTQMPGNMNSGDGFFWDKTNPAVFYYACSNALCKATITGQGSLTTSTLRTFAAFAEVGPMNYAGHATDGTTINLVGRPSSGNYTIFSFNVASLTTGDSILTSCAQAFGTIGAQPGNDCLHKLQETGDGHLMIDYNPPSSTPGQYISQGTSQVQVWTSGKTAHHVGGLQPDGTSIWVSVDDPSTQNESSGSGNPNSDNPCDQNVGVVYLKVSDLIGGGSAPFTDHCLFSNYFVQDGHFSWQGGPNQPWILQIQADGGSGNSTCEFWFTTNGSFCNPTSAQPYGNNQGSGPGVWTTYMSEMILIPSDCLGNTSGAGCNQGASGRKPYRLAYNYNRANEGGGFWMQPEGNISADGRFILMNSALGYQSGCPASIDAGQGQGCGDVYLMGPLF